MPRDDGRARSQADSMRRIECSYAYALKRHQLGRARQARAIGRRLQAALDVFADRLPVQPRAPGNGGDTQALFVQLQDHDQLSNPDHPRSPPNPSRVRWPPVGRWPAIAVARQIPSSPQRIEVTDFQSPDLARIAPALTGCGS